MADNEDGFAAAYEVLDVAVPVMGDAADHARRAEQAAKGTGKTVDGTISTRRAARGSRKSVSQRDRLRISPTGKVQVGASGGSSGGRNRRNSTKKKRQDKQERVQEQCFTGDTLVLTSEGYCPIQKIQKGDEIYSRNVQTGESGFRKVTEVYQSQAYTIYHIWLDGKEEIRTTAYHPIFVKDEGWVSAMNLREGSFVETMEGSAHVTKIEKVRQEEPVEVFNVHVEEWESYFVSESQMYVHNCGEEPARPYAHLDDSRYAVRDRKNFSAAQKRKIIEANRSRNGGVLRSDLDGQELFPATRSRKGALPEHFWDEVQIDHIDPKSKGGRNSFKNAQVLSRRQNLTKSNK